MLQEHLVYLSDAARLEQFRRAIRAVVRPGDRVADLGCGSGVLGLLALQAGAGHVYAVDDGAMVHVARDSLARAGYGGRVSFLQGRSQQVELPERVDVVVCDHVGHFGFDYGIVDLLRDARTRFLKPGGALVPARIRLQLAAVESAQAYRPAQEWRAGVVPAEYGWLRDYAVNATHAVNLRREELLSGPAEIGAIDLRAADEEFFAWKAGLRMERDGLVHGLAGWFECELAEQVRMTNSPLAAGKIDRAQIFLPIAEPVTVKAGDLVQTRLMARPDDNLLAWTVEFPAGGRRFSHSTWQGMLLSPEDLQRSNPARVPRTSRRGVARGIVLGYCDGSRTASDIEQAVLREHPGLFPSRGEVSRYVAQVLGRDTE